MNRLSFRLLIVLAAVLGIHGFGQAPAVAQAFGLESLEPIGAYLDGIFPDSTPGTDGVPDPPALLSQTGAFADLATLTPRIGLIPYAPNSPLWSDGAVKQRWVAIPNDGVADSPSERIGFSADDSWSFPVGTVFVKQFDLPTDARDPSQIRRLETRFMVSAADGTTYGVTYRWREDGSEADLLLGGEDAEVTVTDANGTTSRQTWSFPSREDCLNCHNENAGYVLGLRTHQLNGDLAYAATGRSDNQLRALNHLGLLSPSVDETSIETLPRSVSVSDTSADLETRARSYLDANCSQCHRPDNLATAFDARFTTSLADQHLINGPVIYDLGVADAQVVAPQSIQRSILHRRMSSVGIHQMPPIGRNVIDEEAVAVISDWIQSLEPDTGGSENRSPVAQDDRANTLAGEGVDIPVLSNDTDLDGDALTVTTWSEPSHGSLEWLSNGFARYTPEANYLGEDSFTYETEDDNGAVSNTGTVTISILPATSSGAISFLDRSSRLHNPSHSSGVAMGVADMDQDGLDDIVHLASAKTLRIDYQTPNGGKFFGQNLGQVSNQRQWGLAIADADDNGYPDIISGGYYDNLHLRWNNGGRSSFNSQDLSSPRVFLQTINFADMNGDGWLDIFACHDVGDNAKFRGGSGRSFVYDNSLINTRTVPSSDNSGNYGTVWTDYDNDGDLDLYLSKCRGGVSSSSDPRRINMFFRNDGAAGFTNIAAQPGIGMAFGAQSWAADFGDINNDGHLDCFVGNHHEASVLMRSNGDGTFSNVTAASGLDVDWRVIQTVFRDFNNDGWVDLLLTGDDHELWLNDRDGTFTLSPDPFTQTTYDIESCAVGDLNRDGFTDVYAGYARTYNTPRADQPDRLHLATPNGNGFLSVTLKGVSSNRSAIGARLELHGSWGVQVREVRAGESYGISHSFTQIFGLGNASTIDKLRVRWPSGLVEEIFDPMPNRFLELQEGSAAPPVLQNPGPQANQLGQNVSLALNASDPSNDVLVYDAVNLPPGLSIDPSTGVISGALSGNDAGNYSVVVSASDSWTEVSQTFAWEVQAEQSAPAVIVSTGSAIVTGAFQASARFTADVNGFDLSDVQVTNGVASSLTGNGDTYAFNITPTSPGNVTIAVPAGAATDNDGRASLVSNTLPVTYRLPFTAPELSSFASDVNPITEGESAELQWSVTDGGTALTELRIDPGGFDVLGQPSFSVSPTETTTYILTATNAVGSVSAPHTLTVNRPLPTEDGLTNLVAPGSVVQGGQVSVSIDYAATSTRELWVWLQDSEDGWRTATQGNVTLEAGQGQHTFDLGVASDVRVGDGYVWAVRLLPPGWSAADDAVAAEYGLANMQSNGAPPDTDALGAISLPDQVLSPETVSLEIPYQATERREVRVFLHDSQNSWFTVASGQASVEPGVGSVTLSLPVIPDARVGDGYVWAVRLLPLGWTVADDALDADYENASVERNTGGQATQNILTSVDAPNSVQPASVVTVSVDYEATERRDLGIWLHDSTDGWRTIGQGLAKVDPGIGTKTFQIGVVGDARVGDGYIWAVRLLPEGWAVSDEALDAFYKDAQVDERTNELVNLAVLPASSATQSSVYGTVFEADLARDGNTDGDWRNGSVTHTELDVDAWWEVDLGSVQAVDHVLLWNRTDCCGERLVPYHVFASETPFVSTSISEVAAQDGVTQLTFNAVPLPTQRIDLNRNARYIRIQIAGSNYLSLAEVEVYAPLDGNLVNGITYGYYEGTWTALPDFETLNPILTGTTPSIDLDVRRRDDFFAVRYRGCLAVQAEGTYTFALNSDEGSRLFLGGTLVVDNDGVHTVQEASGSVFLTEGMHTLELQYFEREGPEVLEVFWEGPGIAREALPASSITVNETGENLGFHHVGRRVPTHDNADGDLLDLAAEYALGRDPSVASMNDVGIDLQAVNDDSGINVTYDRPANQWNITYWLEVSRDLVAWTPILTPNRIESIRYGWERVHHDALESHSAVDIDRGFVRLRIWHRDWNYETTTPICGWYRTSLHGGYQTHGVSLNAPPVYASTIKEVDLEHARLTTAAEGLSSDLLIGRHYLEIASGPHEGHRIDIDSTASAGQMLQLDLRGATNTLNALPEGGLRFSQVRASQTPHDRHHLSCWSDSSAR